MKKFIALILTVLLILAVFTSCGAYQEPTGERLSIVSTIYPYYDFAKEITGDMADLTMLVPAGSEIHDYEPTPKDILKIQNADIFIYNGGESDEWVEDILSSIDFDAKVLCMFDFVNPLCADEHSIDGDSHHSHSEDEHHHDEDEHHHQYDEHIWTSPKNAMIFTQVISKEIQNIDTTNQKLYKENTKEYLNKLNAIDLSFETLADTCQRDTIVIADRFPLLYFTEEYNLNYVSAFSGCSSDTQPSVKIVTKLIDYIKANNVPVVFNMDNTNETFATLISEDTDSKTSTLYSCGNITSKQFAQGVSYISLMELNYSALKEALN